MIYTLQEIALPLAVAFLAGVGAGWFAWRWRRTPVSYNEWTTLKASASDGEAAARAGANGSPDQSQRLADMSAALDIRDIEIAELRKAIIDNVDEN